MRLQHKDGHSKETALAAGIKQTGIKKYTSAYHQGWDGASSYDNVQISDLAKVLSHITGSLRA